VTSLNSVFTPVLSVVCNVLVRMFCVCVGSLSYQVKLIHWCTLFMMLCQWLKYNVIQLWKIS